jgi:hypothetical protein
MFLSLYLPYNQYLIIMAKSNRHLGKYVDPNTDYSLTFTF